MLGYLMSLFSYTKLKFFWRTLWKEKFYEAMESQNNKDPEYFFDCENFEETKEENNSTYFIKLPPYQESFLTALESRIAKGVYATFDEDSSTCVVDNCANIHIWNEISDFIPNSYVKFSATSNANVSAVNGATNAPEGVGNVELS